MSEKIFVDSEQEADYKLIITLIKGLEDDRVIETLVTKQFTYCLNSVQDQMVENIYLDSRDENIHSAYSWKLERI
jgi:hypothetical protein